jgi:hypothetical protein
MNHMTISLDGLLFFKAPIFLSITINFYSIDFLVITEKRPKDHLFFSSTFVQDFLFIFSNNFLSENAVFSAAL